MIYDNEVGDNTPGWDDKFPRESLTPLRLYHEEPTGLYFYTPDGMGCIWFSDRKEALAETDAFGQPIITLCQELSDY